MPRACLTLLFLPILFVTNDDAPPSGWEEAPRFVALFAPRAAAASYRAYASRAALDEAIASIREELFLHGQPGAFEPQPVAALDAFGQSGGYNRWKLAGLYGARRARVARGPRIENGQAVEAWTLISPYPDPTLSRLEPGTLLLVLRLR